MKSILNLLGKGLDGKKIHVIGRHIFCKSNDYLYATSIQLKITSKSQLREYTQMLFGDMTRYCDALYMVEEDYGGKPCFVPCETGRIVLSGRWRKEYSCMSGTCIIE